MKKELSIDWVFDLPEHIISRVFSFFSTRELLQTTCINHKWNAISPTFWTEVELLHRVPDNIKAKIITRSSSSLKSIHFIFYFDYLLAFGALKMCNRLKHLTIGEGGLTWIAGANAATANSTSNSPSSISQAYAIPAPPTQAEGEGDQAAMAANSTIDADSRLLMAKATSAANMAADAANEANAAANSAFAAAHQAATISGAAAASLGALLPGTLTATLQAAINEISAAIAAANGAAAAAATAANAAASAANASSIAVGMTGHVVRYHALSPSAALVTPSAESSSRGKKRKETTQAQGFSAKQIKTLRVTSGRSSTKVIPYYRHLFLFSNLRSLTLDGCIAPAHLESVILSARLLHTLRLNCSESGAELHSLRFASSLRTLTLDYFTPLLVGSVCGVPSLTSISLHFTSQYQQLGLAQLVPALTELKSVSLSHPTLAIALGTPPQDSELIHLCSIRKLEHLGLNLPNCDTGIFAELPLTSLKTLETSMMLPMAFMQKQPNLYHLSLTFSHLPLSMVNATTLFPPGFAQSIPQLRSLRLTGVNLTPHVIIVLVQLQLRKLEVWCEEVEAKDIEALLLHSNTLEFVDIYVAITNNEVSKEWVKNLPKANPKITVNVFSRHSKRK